MVFKDIKQKTVLEQASSISIYFSAVNEENIETDFKLLFSFDTENYQNVKLFEIQSLNKENLVGNFKTETVVPYNQAVYIFAGNPKYSNLNYCSENNDIVVKIAENYDYINITYQENNVGKYISIDLKDKAKSALDFFFKRFLTLSNILKDNQYLVQYVSNSLTNDSESLDIKATEVTPNIGDFVTIDNIPNIFVVKNRLILESNYPNLKTAIKLIVSPI